jgi:UDP-N-acetylmuramyl pentapeptide phosphotransferase/UDP-N-acetylglucosamine-1-phosphate transferase
VLETVLLVALSANLINLFDRAPGRAGKVALGAALPLVVWGSDQWLLPAAGFLGGLIALLAHDLKARAMLGDAGANPVGALLGLGLAMSLPQAGRWAAIILLLALNGASEKWSFSRLIEGSPVLSRVDAWGREVDPKNVP